MDCSEPRKKRGVGKFKLKFKFKDYEKAEGGRRKAEKASQEIGDSS